MVVRIIVDSRQSTVESQGQTAEIRKSKLENRVPAGEFQRWIAEFRFSNFEDGRCSPAAESATKYVLRLVSGCAILTPMFSAYANWFSYRFWGFSLK